MDDETVTPEYISVPRYHGPASKLGWLLFAASLIMVLASTYLGYKQYSYVHCQTLVNDSFVKALKARTDAAEADRNAMDQLVSDVSNAKTRDDSVRALAKYRETRAKADADRRQHPLPEPASSSC